MWASSIGVGRQNVTKKLVVQALHNASEVTSNDFAYFVTFHRQAFNVHLDIFLFYCTALGGSWCCQ